MSATFLFCSLSGWSYTACVTLSSGEDILFQSRFAEDIFKKLQQSQAPWNKKKGLAQDYCTVVHLLHYEQEVTIAAHNEPCLS